MRYLCGRCPSAAACARQPSCWKAQKTTCEQPAFGVQETTVAAFAMKTGGWVKGGVRGGWGSMDGLGFIAPAGRRGDPPYGRHAIPARAGAAGACPARLSVAALLRWRHGGACGGVYSGWAACSRRASRSQ